MNTPTAPTPGSLSRGRLGGERGHPLGKEVFWLRGWSPAKGRKAVCLCGSPSLSTACRTLRLRWAGRESKFLLDGETQADKTGFRILN